MNSYWLHVLFDLGSTHSFIFKKFIDSMRLKKKKMPYEMLVTTPLGKSVVWSRIMSPHFYTIFFPKGIITNNWYDIFFLSIFIESINLLEIKEWVEPESNNTHAQ